MTELRVLQYRTSFINGTAILGDLDSSSTGLDQRLRLIDIAYIEENEMNLEFLDGSKNDVWSGTNDKIVILVILIVIFMVNHSSSGYTPYDGVTKTRIVTVNVSVTVLFTLMNIGGLLFAFTCFVFTIVCRRNK